MALDAGGMDVSDVLGKIAGLTPQMQDAARRGVRLAGEYVLGESQDIAPHETGDLQNSGRVSMDAKTATAYVSYDTPYAVVQHEDMTFQHDPGRRAKYLEGPLNESKAAVTKIIQQTIAREVFGA